MERGSGVHRSGTMIALGELANGEAGRRRVSSRKSSAMARERETEGLQRKESTTKGFL
jgi:hypothetical protein